MDPKPSATPTSRGAQPASAGSGPQVNVRKTVKKMAGTAVDKSVNQHASSRKSVGKGEHSGTGTSRKRKRKKSSGAAASAVPSHPSVLEAGACTKRQEQVEEARARETVYSTPRTESVASQVEETRDTAANTGSSAVDDNGLVGNRSRASKVEETRDAASNTGSAAGGDNGLVGNGSRASKVEETRDAASNTGASAGDDALAGNRSRARRPWEWSAKDCDAVMVNVLSRARPEVESSEGELMGEDKSASNCPGVRLGRGSGNRKRQIGRGGQPSNGKVNAAEDERKAREVSAALNRNNPRTASRNKLGGAPQTRISVGKVRASSTSRRAADDEKEARNLSVLLNRNSPRRGLKSPRDGVRSKGSDSNNPEEDRRASGGGIRCDVGDGRSDSPTAVRTSCTLKGGKGHRRASKGVALGKGSAVEALWDDRKWYRCTLSSISAEGTHGVLEFLPYRRQNHAREFSTQLELEAWVRAGKLVLPGTHLKWD